MVSVLAAATLPKDQGSLPPLASEVGLIPGDWASVKLRQISRPVRGGSPRPAGDPRYFNGSHIPWLTVAALTNIPVSQMVVLATATYLTEEGANHSRTLEAGTLIIANSGATLGVAKILGLRCCANDGIAALLGLSEAFCPRFLVHYINAKTEYLREVVARGNGQPNLNTTLIGDFSVPAPPTRKEQEAIAEALSDADVLIESLEALIAKKRAIKQGVTQDLLSGCKRLPGFGGEWRKCTFGEVFDFFPTATNSRADLSSEGDSYYVHYGDIHTRFHSHLDFAGQSVPKISRTLCPNAAPLKNGDWIMADASEDFGGVGKSIEVSGLQQETLAVSGLHTFLLREKVETFAPGYKGHLGNSEELRRQYLRVMTGMKVYGVSKTALKDLLLPIPEWEEQVSITAILDDLDGELAALEAKLAKARQIKHGMMQELLTGRIRLV